MHFAYACAAGMMLQTIGKLKSNLIMLKIHFKPIIAVNI